jgi:hypothetical protein
MGFPRSLRLAFHGLASDSRRKLNTQIAALCRGLDGVRPARFPWLRHLGTSSSSRAMSVKVSLSRILSHEAVEPGEAALVDYAVTRSSFTARTSISYSRPIIGGRAKCQVSPCDAAPRATRRSATKLWISCTA